MKITRKINASADVYKSKWWENDYQDISIQEVSWITGETPEEIEDEINSAIDGTRYQFETFMSYNGDQDVDLYDIVMLCVAPDGDEFLAQIDDRGKLLDVTPDIYEMLGYADESEYYREESEF